MSETRAAVLANTKNNLTVTGVTGAAAQLNLKADQSNQDGDRWSIKVADGGADDAGALTINNEVSGNEVAMLTIDPVATASDSIVRMPAHVSMGAKRVASFGVSLANIGTATVTDNDVIIKVGSLDVLPPPGFNTVTNILVQKVFVNITTESANAQDATLFLGSASDQVLNDAVTDGVEVVGVDATYKVEATNNVGGALANQTQDEVDIGLDTAGLFIANPNISVPVARNNLYLCSADTSLPDVSATRLNVLVEYLII